MTHIDYPEDCAALQAALARIGVTASLEEVDRFWTWRSDQWSAGWLAFNDSDADANVRTWWPRYQAIAKIREEWKAQDRAYLGDDA